MGHIRTYASMLLKAEADQYEQLRGDPLYPVWLSRLVDRVIEHVLKSLKTLDGGDPDTLLLNYHGLQGLGIEEDLRGLLWELTHPYTGGIAGPAVDIHPKLPLISQEAAKSTSKTPPEPENTFQSTRVERTALRDAYRVAFPDVKIADIIWAAKQTRREWTRWIGGEAKDGLKADRSFRHVLMSSKTPEVLMGKPRPTKYNV
jgi:hypothetical protein